MGRNKPRPSSPPSLGRSSLTQPQNNQGRQSAKLFSSRRNWDSPNPSPAGECAPSPPPPGSGGRGHIRWRERGVPIPTRGYTLWYSLYKLTLWPQNNQGRSRNRARKGPYYNCIKGILSTWYFTDPVVNSKCYMLPLDRGIYLELKIIFFIFIILKVN